MYIPTYIYTQKLLPTFLWVSKFYIKRELLEPKKEKSTTCCNCEIFAHDPQFEMKF